MVGIVCFGAGALRMNLFGELGELGKIAGPFGDERFDAFVFFFFGERVVVSFELSVENFVLEGCGIFVCEVVKCISGTSEFDIDLLRELLTENKAAETAVLQELEQIESETADEESRIRHLAEQYKYIKDWAEAFDKVPADTKKMILARLIRKITLTRGYHITIHFFVTLEDFFDDFSATEEQPQTPAM